MTLKNTLYVKKTPLSFSRVQIKLFSCSLNNNKSSEKVNHVDVTSIILSNNLHMLVSYACVHQEYDAKCTQQPL